MTANLAQVDAQMFNGEPRFLVPVDDALAGGDRRFAVVTRSSGGTWSTNVTPPMSVEGALVGFSVFSSSNAPTGAVATDIVTRQPLSTSGAPAGGTQIVFSRTLASDAHAAFFFAAGSETRAYAAGILQRGLPIEVFDEAGTHLGSIATPFSSGIKDITAYTTPSGTDRVIAVDSTGGIWVTSIEPGDSPSAATLQQVGTVPSTSIHAITAVNDILFIHNNSSSQRQIYTYLITGGPD